MVRDLPFPPDDAYAWLTDYREDDMRRIFGDEGGKRMIEKLGSDRLRVQSTGMIAGVRGHADGVITLRPPDSWMFDGHITAMARKMVHVDALWNVAPLGDGRTRFTSRFRITPQNFIAKAYLKLRPRWVRKRIERDYDQIAAAIAKDLGGAAQVAAGSR